MAVSIFLDLSCVTGSWSSAILFLTCWMSLLLLLLDVIILDVVVFCALLLCCDLISFDERSGGGANANKDEDFPASANVDDEYRNAVDCKSAARHATSLPPIPAPAIIGPVELLPPIVVATPQGRDVVATNA